VVMKNGDTYVGVVRSIPHDYDTLHGDAKDFSIIDAFYLPKDSAAIQQLHDQTVLLNTADVDAIHLVQ
jgi:hypothetical protein